MRSRMQYINTMIQLDKLSMGDNPRLPTNLNIGPLADNIENLGKLLEPITVWQPNGDDQFEVIRGHRRTMAIQTIAERSPKVFEDIFGKGVPAFVVEGCSPEDVVELKLDHTEQQSLSDPHEVQMSADMLFAIRRTEAEVAVQLQSLIEKISPMKSKSKVALKELEDKLSDAKAQGKAKAIEAVDKEIKKFIAEYRRGYVQHLHDVYRSPLKVNASLYYKACGIKPKGFETEDLPRLTNSQVNTLWKAHKEDLEIKDEESGAPKYNQVRIGPQFTEKWDKIVAAEKAAVNGEPTAPKPKAMSAKEMASEVTEGRWSSVGFCKLTNWHCGDKGVEGLDRLDEQYHLIDLVAKEQPDLLEMVVTEGIKIRAELVKADKEAAEAAKGTGTEG